MELYARVFAVLKEPCFWRLCAFRLLISSQEITRRVNLQNIWQAAYTAGTVLPKPVATAQYWHRSLNPKKLIGVGFSRIGVRPA